MRALAFATIVVATTATALIPTAPPADPTANIWIQVGGGTCAGGRSATPITLANAASPDRICGSFDSAWDAMNAGDTARCVAGTYPEQLISGNKLSETFIKCEGGTTIGDGGAGVDCTLGSWAVICAEANYMTLENVTAVVADPGPNGALKVDGANVTVRDFIARGAASADGFYASSIGVHAANFLWDGGSLGRTDTVETATCDHSTVEPFWLQSGGDNATIDGVEVGRYEPKVQAGPNCGADNTPHIETIRFEDADNVTFRNNRFNGPSNAGSGHIFTSSTPDNARFVNNIFEDRVLANGMVQCNGCTATGWEWLYNTILDDGGSAILGTLVGNFGHSLGCGATNILNVYAGSGSCGTNVYIGAQSFEVDANGKLLAGSPAIDAAETPDASDHCTGAVVASSDFEGTARPQGTRCDAGADER